MIYGFRESRCEMVEAISALVPPLRLKMQRSFCSAWIFARERATAGAASSDVKSEILAME